MRTPRDSEKTWTDAELSDREIMSAVCKYFCEGYLATEITALMKERHNVEMRREMPYKYIAKAASQGCLRFVAPHAYILEQQIIRKYGWLGDAKAVHTAVGDHVAYEAAEMLLHLLRQHRTQTPRKDKDEGVVHIGFAGGRHMRKVAQALAQLLRQPAADLPDTVVFHAMVAGFDVRDPTTDPNAFFSYFVDDLAIQAKTEFVGLHAPAMVKTRMLRSLRTLPAIKEVYASVSDLDIIVTAAASWSDKHSQLKKYMSRSRPSMDVLEKAGCLGDMMWRPIGPDGPIGEPTDIRAMTLMELEQFPDFIRRGKHVLLVVGPCEVCGTSRADILAVILNQKQRLITHLVVDVRSAGKLLAGAET